MKLKIKFTTLIMPRGTKDLHNLLGHEFKKMAEFVLGMVVTRSPCFMHQAKSEARVRETANPLF